LSVSKITWQQVGRVTEPGRYMFKFGWLTIADEDLAIWEQFPNAAFTLVSHGSIVPAEEFRLGAYNISPGQEQTGAEGKT
jgi:hypothetical protein